MLFSSNKNDNETPWLSISDMMTILMFLFLLCFMIILEKNSQFQVRSNIREELITGFSKEDLERWGATINEDGDIAIEYITFEVDKYDLTGSSKKILDEFFPEYIEYIEKFQDKISDIKIEGHTDSDGSYIYNLRLSQDRSREVLTYVLNSKSYDQKNWFFYKLSASGRSESQLIINENGREDKQKSRRVTFRIILHEPKS